MSNMSSWNNTSAFVFSEFHLGGLEVSPPGRFIFLCVSVPLILYTVLSNSLVIHAIRKYSSLRNPSNMFLLSLAVTDLGSGILLMPVACYYSWCDEWPFGMEECKMWVLASGLLVSCSIHHLCAVSVDRYLAIAYPVAYFNQRSVSNSFAIIGVLWGYNLIVIILTYYSPLGFVFPDSFEEDTPCTVLEDNTVMAFKFMSMVVVPMMVMLGMYFGLYRKKRDRLGKKLRSAEDNSAKSSQDRSDANYKANPPDIEKDKEEEEEVNEEAKEEKGREKNATETKEGDEKLDGKEVNDNVALKHVVKGSKRRVQMSSVDVNGMFTLSLPKEGSTPPSNKATTPLTKNEEATSDCKIQFLRSEVPRGNDDLNHLTAEERLRLENLVRRERSYILLTVAIAGTFVLSFVPAFIVYGYLALKLPVSPWLKSLAWWLMYLNSASNPIIYTVLNKDFRDAFASIFRKAFRRVQSS